MTRHASALTRRDFLRTGAAAAFGLAALPALAADDKDEFGGFVLGIQSYTFRNFNLEQALKRIKDCGVKHAEFYNDKKQVPRDATDEQLDAIFKLLKEYDVKPIAYGVERFSKNHDANKKVFDFCKKLGVKSISADPDPDSFDSLDKLVEEYKIPVAIHPHGPVGKDQLHRWYSAEVIMKAVKDHHKLIGSCLDTGHLIRADQLGKKLDPAEEVRVMGDRNFGMHLKDHDNKAKRDVVFGKGVLDIPAVLKALREVKFKGTLSIEYEHNPADCVGDVKDCVAVFKESVKKL